MGQRVSLAGYGMTRQEAVKSLQYQLFYEIGDHIRVQRITRTNLYYYIVKDAKTKQVKRVKIVKEYDIYKATL